MKIWSGLDAGHLLPQREERPLPQHPRQQCLHQVQHLLCKVYIIARACYKSLDPFYQTCQPPIIILQDIPKWRCAVQYQVGEHLHAFQLFSTLSITLPNWTKSPQYFPWLLRKPTLRMSEHRKERSGAEMIIFQDLTHPLLPDEPEALPNGQADLRAQDSKL